MAARLGNTESIITNQNSNYYTKFWLKYLYTTSGFFSKKIFTNDIEKLFVKNDVDLYAQKMIKCVKNCDFHLCCFSNEIPLLNKYSDKKSLNFDWYDLYTNFDSNSWLKALECKKVLIISSFNKSIKYQLKNIKKVFPFFDFPNLNIVYYDFPLTFMGNYNSKENFFELYTFVFNEIKKIDFDIALIAAGAYGYMLASDIKDAGKQAIELCSGLYPVFGIKNKTQSIIRKVSAMYNENWIFPIEAKPEKYMDIEKGAYWE